MPWQSARGLVALLVLSILACGKPAAPPEPAPPPAKPAPPLIRAVGVYHLPGMDERLSLDPAPEGGLFYRVGDSPVLDENAWGLIPDASAPWFLSAAGDGTVWVYAETLGVVRWTRLAENSWQSVKLERTDVDNVAVMPKVFLDALPEDLNRIWLPRWEVLSKSAATTEN